MTGLFVARTIVEAHGGEIRIDDHSGCVRVMLPPVTSEERSV